MASAQRKRSRARRWPVSVVVETKTARAGKRAFKSLDERLRGEHFTDRHRVNPDRARRSRGAGNDFLRAESRNARPGTALARRDASPARHSKARSQACPGR